MWLAQLYNVLAGIYYERNDLAEALAHVQKAQELYEAIEDKLDVAVVVNLACLLYPPGPVRASSGLQSAGD